MTDLPHDTYLDAVDTALHALGHTTTAWTETPDGQQLDAVIRIENADTGDWARGVFIVWDQNAGWALVDHASQTLDELDLAVYAHPDAVAQRAHTRIATEPDRPVSEHWDGAQALAAAVTAWQNTEQADAPTTPGRCLMATGPEHYQKAEFLLRNAEYIAYEDDNNDAGAREDYPDEQSFYAALAHAARFRKDAVAEAAMLGTLAQGHATLALAAATAIHSTPEMTVEQGSSWAVAISQSAPAGREALARTAYAAYGTSTGGLTHDGRPMPAWDDLGERVQTAWRAAAHSVAAPTPGIEA